MVSIVSRSGVRRGFTLLELIIAVTLLVTFLLPMILIVTNSKVRAIRYTQQREVRDLAQRKLFDRMHYYEERDSGDFTAEGRSSWTWVVSPPELVGNSEQVLLQYKITVMVPQQLGDAGTAASEGGEGSQFEMTVWAFPDERWYVEQEDLYARGIYSPLYGDPSLGGGSY